jgi:antitoxin component of MazEF toxin-antitoxin module
MQTQVKKWGSGLALRIPKAFADEMAITPDSSVDISLVEGKLVIQAISEPEFTRKNS